ncbi:MAG: Bug family tripartite tricarboxylate transporter substrate binding protein [Burkholderiales bacterium]
MKQQLVRIASFLLLGLGCGPLGAQDFPTRPISIGVPVAPGGTIDINARPLAQALTKILGQSVVVVNRPGAGGAIGTAFVANSKPDGYTVIMPRPTISATPVADELFGRKPSYTMDQFTSIALLSADPNMLGTRIDGPWKSIRELVTDARQNPGRINYGTSGNYGSSHFITEIFANAAGIKLNHVAYSGGGPALTAMLGGEVALTPVTPSQAVPHVQSGKLRVLASGGAKRTPVLPDVPTFRELGYDFEYHLWVGMLAPASTPPAILKVLRDAVRQAAQSPELVQSLAKMKVDVAYLDAPEFEKFWREDARRVADVVKRLGRIE